MENKTYWKCIKTLKIFDAELIAFTEGKKYEEAIIDYDYIVLIDNMKNKHKITGEWLSYFSKIIEKGINKIGEVDGVSIYQDEYHPDKTLSIQFENGGTEIKYIISKYDDISIFENIKKQIGELNTKHKEFKKAESGYIYCPYVMAEHTKESLDVYNTFMLEYKNKHEVCPKCGTKEHSSTLVGYILNSDKREEYKDLNICNCISCGDVHKTHDRISIEEFKNKK